MFKHRNHTIDTAFALVLFAVFAISSILLVLLGAGIYGRIGEKMNKMDAPVILSYITEKLRSCEGADSIWIKEEQQLLLQEDSLEECYVTWIYVEDGYLKEILMPEGKEPIEHAGNSIAPIQNFSVREISEQMLEITVEDWAGSIQTRYYSFPVYG